MLDEKKIHGLTPDEWKEVFRPGMPEFAATRFTFTAEAAEQIRIAFGNHGPFLSEQTRSARYTHAVTLPPEAAMELARILLKHLARPRPRKEGPVDS